MPRHSNGTRPLALLALVLLGGCAVVPEPLTTAELAANAADKAQRVVDNQEPIRGAIDLRQAMARALKYNLDHKVEIHESALRVAELDLSHYNMLPNAVANSGYAVRNHPSASSSYNLVTDAANFGYSTSQDERLRTSDMAFSWHVLDFGLSYVRARQAADKALIAEEARRKVVHRLMEDVRTAYWRTWSAQKLVGKLKRLEIRTRAALANSRILSADRTTSPVTAITYRRELIEIQRTLQELQRELSVAKYQLAALMNVRPGTPFTVASPSAAGKVRLPATDMSELVRFALENRPEMHDVLYRQRINAHDAHAALLELLPGIQLYSGPNWDSNSFLLHDQWVSWGAKASWNLLKVFQYPAKRAVVEAQDKLLDQRALALTMAIATQVYVSRARVQHFRGEFDTAASYHRTQQDLLQHIRHEHGADRVSEQTLLREELNAAVAEVRLDIAGASLQNGLANLIASLGVDPLPTAVPDDVPIAEIMRALGQQRSTAVVRPELSRLASRPE